MSPPRRGHLPQALAPRLTAGALNAYRAKEATSGCELYAAEHDQHSRDRLALLADLRRAIDQEQLVVQYQPKVDLGTGALAGVEALARWQHPERGRIPPGAFVPHAEHTGFIKPLTMYVLRTAMAQCREWQQAGIDVPLAVNLSARNLLDRRLPEDVAALLEQAGLKRTVSRWRSPRAPSWPTPYGRARSS